MEETKSCENCLHKMVCHRYREQAAFPNSDFQDLFKHKLITEDISSLARIVAEEFWKRISKTLAENCQYYHLLTPKEKA